MAKSSKQLSATVRFFQLLAILVLSAFLILCATLCVVEVAGRIAALQYVDSRISNIEERIARQGSTPQSSDVSNLRRLGILRRIEEELGYLAFSGASDPGETIVAIRYRLSGDLAIAQREQRVQELNNEIDSVRAGIAEVNNDSFVSENFLDTVTRLSDTYSDEPRIAQLAVGPEREGAQNLISYIRSRGRDEFAQEKSRLLPTGYIDMEDMPSGAFDDLRQLSEAIILTLNQQLSAASNFGMDWSPSFYVRLNRLLYMPTDILVAIAVVCCGAIGSIASATRRVSPHYMRSMITGFLAGFIAFLLVKGGKSIFYFDSRSATVVSINPYAIAFTGILAGLFTERAFGVLSEMVDELGDRITSKNRQEEPNTSKELAAAPLEATTKDAAKNKFVRNQISEVKQP